MAIKYVFVTGGVVSGLGKGCIPWTAFEGQRISGDYAEIRSIHQY